MKPFIFDEQEFEDLGSLGLAFISKFDLALQAIKEKSFIKFFKHFKAYKKTIQYILYQSRYLQNALSMIIYLVTEEHILYVGHRRYANIQSVLKDIKKNPTFQYFAEDHGFSNTILPTLEDEKLKADLKAFEEYYTDDFCVEYLEGYMNKDSIESIDGRLSRIPEAKDSFKEALHIFSSKKIQLSMAYRYSLAEVLEMRKKHCPVFKGFEIVMKDYEYPLTILENAFYQSLLKNYKQYKYKKIEGKNYRNKVKAMKRSAKKYKKMSDSEKISWNERLHTLYLEWIDLYKLERIVILEADLEPNYPYCETYISSKDKEELMLEPDSSEKPYTPVLQCEYNLNRLNKSLKNHGYFSFWMIFLVVLVTIGYLFFGMIPALRDMVIELLEKVSHQQPDAVENFPSLVNILFYVGAAGAFVVAVVILVLRTIAKRKYNALCRLAYYRKHENILNEKEQANYDKIKPNEARYAKTIDRFYRFYGGVGMAFLSLAVTIFALGLIYSCSFVVSKSFAADILTLYQSKLFFICIGPVLCLLLGFARHKKTAWSVLFTYFFSILIAVAILFLVKL
ncbi:MAG: hypothetical protein K2J85_00310 [Anaeroplasmataceae bacterium]|nr:hypothetical protein [Anaeroplasmataceae bacterium]